MVAHRNIVSLVSGSYSSYRCLLIEHDVGDGDDIDCFDNRQGTFPPGSDVIRIYRGFGVLYKPLHRDIFVRDGISSTRHIS